MTEAIRVFWQPHWTSCIRVKDYLKEKGIEFESINIVEDGIETLQRLGAKSVPVVSKGDKENTDSVLFLNALNDKKISNYR